MGSGHRSVISVIAVALGIYFATLTCVLAGFWFGWQHVAPPLASFHRANDVDFLDILTHWDGRWYLEIAEDGYSFRSGRQSNVAFFPGYPIVGRIIAASVGIDSRLALVLVANVLFVATLVTIVQYERAVVGAADLPSASWPAVVLAVWPISLFYRAAYSESLFMLIEAIVLLGMRRNWPYWTIAVLIGALTASRSVGMAMVVAFAFYLWGRRPSGGSGRYFATVSLWMLVACWGIAGYMAYQWREFGDPLAFIKTQSGWREREPQDSFLDSAVSLVTLEPARDVYDPRCICFWHRDPPHGEPYFNLTFWNPIILFSTAAIVAAGWRRKIVSFPEFVFAELALGIPYVFQAYTHCFMSGARFGVVIMPCFVVLGRAFGQLPSAAAAIIVGVSMTWLFVFSIGFAADYWIF
jgi:hypothetical protein